MNNKDLISDQLFDARQTLDEIIKDENFTPRERDLAMDALKVLWDLEIAMMDD
jgi:hypothetical protein